MAALRGVHAASRAAPHRLHYHSHGAPRPPLRLCDAQPSAERGAQHAAARWPVIVEGRRGARVQASERVREVQRAARVPRSARYLACYLRSVQYLRAQGLQGVPSRLRERDVVDPPHRAQSAGPRQSKSVALVGDETGGSTMWKCGRPRLGVISWPGRQGASSRARQERARRAPSGRRHARLHAARISAAAIGPASA